MPFPQFDASVFPLSVSLRPIDRDDPDLDETTRLRNRIAELESLVRELRGMLYFLYDAQIEA